MLEEEEKKGACTADGERADDNLNDHPCTGPRRYRGKKEIKELS
jgi:hypothetical protein